MSPTLLLILLFIAGIVLLGAELFLPTQGVLGILGAAALLGGIGIGFWIAPWLGVTLLLGVLIASPFVATAAINIWPKTAYGKRVVLSPDESRIVVPRVIPGQAARALSELRPTGEIETCDGTRLEAKSEQGMIRAGTDLTIVGYIEGCVVVRAHVASTAATTGNQDRQGNDL